MMDCDFLKYRLRDYQKKSCEELLAKIKEYKRPLLLVQPTGTGKTRTAMALCLELLHNKLIRNVVWVAHRYELIDQAKDTLFLCCYLNNGRTEEEYKEDKKANKCQNYDEMDFFSFSMNGGFRDKIERIDESTLVVYDEAHHCVPENSTYCLNDVKNKNARILGLTATPFRTDELTNDGIPFVWKFTKRLDEQDYQQAIQYTEDSIVEKITISAAILNGYLCRFQIFGIKDLLGDIYTEWKSTYSGDISWSDYYHGKLVNTIVSIIRDENIADNRPRPEDGKILIFTKRASGLYKELKENDLLCENKTGLGLLISNDYEYRTYDKNGCAKDRIGSNPEDRSRIVDLFSSNDDAEKSLSVLINNAILTEGFDEPKVTDIILMYDTSSSIRMTQIIGRGLRPYGDEERGCYLYNLASADIVEKIYNGKETLTDINILEELLGEQVGVTDAGEVIIQKNRVSDKPRHNVRNAFPRVEIYEHIKSASLYSEFEIAGVLVVDDLIQCIVSIQEIASINSGEFPSRLSNIFKTMLSNMYSKWQKSDHTFISSFMDYLQIHGKYKSMADQEKDDITLISENIKGRVQCILKGLTSAISIRSAVENTFKEEGIDYSVSDLSFYCVEVLKEIWKL